MQIFVSEYLTCGAWPGDLDDVSLAAEGRAMVEALLADVADVPDWRVATTWDARIEPPRFGRPKVDCRVVRGPVEEQHAFREFAAACDRTFVIAPEFHGILVDRCRLVREAGGRWIGCSDEALALCSDKLRLAAHLDACGIRTIPTLLLPIDAAGRGEPLQAASESGAFEYPLVIKPRDGAGSQETRLVADNLALQHASREFALSEFREAIVQPFVRGRPVSVAAVVTRSEPLEILPIAEQHLSDDGRFHYLGGRVSFPSLPGERAAIEPVIRAACRAVSGLAGYIGFDMILPEDNCDSPVLVEINPRLTTSYLGYRRLSRGLAARIVGGPESAPLEWINGDACFRADGTTG